MKKFFWILLALLIAASSIVAQYKNVQVNNKNNSPNEVTITINPLNPLNLIAASNVNNYYFTFDGGKSWEEGTLFSGEYGIWGDPCVIFDDRGYGYYFHLSRPSFEKWLDRMICQKTLFGGRLWNDPGSYTGLNFPKKQDKEWACADITGGKFDGNIYLTWTEFDKYYFGGFVKPDPLDSSRIMFSYSSDAGESWSKAIRINEISGDCRDSSNTTEGAVPCAGPNSEVYVSWSGPAGIVFDRSTDGGINWLEHDINVVNQVGGWDIGIQGIYRCNGMPITGCDISNGPYRGNIYINYSDQTNGEKDVDIFIVKSTDGGFTWSNPIRANDDALNNNKQQFMSWMAVDPLTGAVNIIFYDRRNYDDIRTDVYLARSTDGGDTFQNIKISEASFKPNELVFFGDYIGISSYYDFVACIWQRMDNSRLSIQFCGIDFKK